MTLHPLITDEEDLIEAAQCGKLDAFTSLYERYFPTVFKRVRYMVPEEDVEDVTQNIFISTIHSIKGFRGNSQFGTWLRTITNRQIADYYRKRHGPETRLDERLHSPHDQAGEDEIREIRQALGKLPQKYQEIILLRFAEGMQFEQIAAAQGCSLEAAKSTFRRAIAALHKQVTNNE